jgi:hypothetical protein
VKTKSYEIVRGKFSGDELENLLWEMAWINWDELKDSNSRYEKNNLSIFDIPQPVQRAVHKMMSMTEAPKGELRAWLEKHKEGDFSKIVWKGPSTGLFLSLGQFRGGRTLVSGFKGYINPGEILKVSITKDEPFQVEKVSSGERIILCLIQAAK